MKSRNWILIFIVCFSNIHAQQSAKKNIRFRTEKYSGLYSYGSNSAKGAVGSISLCAESDSTILFYIDINRGAPSYNMGALYGRFKLKNDSGIFYMKYDFAVKGCKWKFKFLKEKLIIETIDEYDCGFGHAVYADGTFKRTSIKKPEHFETMEGTKVYFKKTKPEDYYKDSK